MRTFHGRPVVPGSAKAEALVSHAGFNTLASFQKSLMSGDKKATCSDQNNAELYGKPMFGKALCMPQTIGSTTGGMVMYCASQLGQQGRVSSVLGSDRFLSRPRVRSSPMYGPTYICRPSTISAPSFWSSL
jgi:predicted aconitase with swiveling domain